MEPYPYNQNKKIHKAQSIMLSSENGMRYTNDVVDEYGLFFFKMPFAIVLCSAYSTNTTSQFRSYTVGHATKSNFADASTYIEDNVDCLFRVYPYTKVSQ